MARTILFFRPFWSAEITGKQLMCVARCAGGLGQLVAIRNADEGASQLATSRTDGSALPSAIRWFESLRPAPNVAFIDATDQTWHQHAIEQIAKASVVIIHLAPRPGPDFRDFAPLDPPTTAQAEPGDFSHNPVRETGTGQGLLRELNYCQQAGALTRTIVLLPELFYPRVNEAVGRLQKHQGLAFLRRTQEGFVPLTEKLSAADHSLLFVLEVPFVLLYKSFGDLLFRWRVRRALKSLLRSARSQPSSDVGNLPPHGIPDDPIPLPPDYQLKQLRFTPAERLTKIPRGEITEISLNEVLMVFPDTTQEELKCPQCERNTEVMFWYQYGLRKAIAQSEEVFMSCQYCGHDDYL